MLLTKANNENSHSFLDISLVIPVYNEEESLPALFQELLEVMEKTSSNFEIIFVDNGSKDRSKLSLRSFLDLLALRWMKNRRLNYKIKEIIK